MSDRLTAIDAKILKLLLADARKPVSEIAEKAGLSNSSCWRRIHSLHESGVIKYETIAVDAKKIGLGFTVIASVKLAVPSEQNLIDFEKQVLNWPEVLECFTVSGAVDYVLRVVTTDIEEYDRFLRKKLLALGTVSDVQSRIVVTEIKNTTMLPLNLVTN